MDFIHLQINHTGNSTQLYVLEMITSEYVHIIVIKGLYHCSLNKDNNLLKKFPLSTLLSYMRLRVAVITG